MAWAQFWGQGSIVRRVVADMTLKLFRLSTYSSNSAKDPSLISCKFSAKSARVLSPAAWQRNCTLGAVSYTHLRAHETEADL
eukprot:3252377-Amphidinium_carterae.1